MSFKIRIGVLVIALVCSFVLSVAAQDATVIKGIIIDPSGSPLAGVVVAIKNKSAATISDESGNFSLATKSFPVTISFSRIGLRQKELTVTDGSAVEVSMEEEDILGREVVISASRFEEDLLESPVTVEKMNAKAISNVASDDYYRAIANLKGVDFVQSSVNYVTLNARGFNTTGNARLVQYLDGVDTQLPSLNHTAGNLNGPTVLDVESIEFLPGTSSALYGPNAFNGVIVQTTKNPFDYQGLSAIVKFGVNHVDDENNNPDYLTGQFPDPQPMWDASFRYAKAFKNKFAFKINFSYSKAKNWYGSTFSDRNAALRPEGFSFNPAQDNIFASGDEVSTALGLVRLRLASTPAFMSSPLAPLLPFLPNHVVARTGYHEQAIVDYDAENMKGGLAVHYKFHDNLELSYALNVGSASTIINAAQRTPVSGFVMQHHKLELKSNDFFIRAYTAIPDAGKAYSGDLTGVLLNNASKPHSQWFQDYAINYLTYVALNPGTNPNDISFQETAHDFARGAADNAQLIPLTPEFEQAKEQITSNVIPNGSRLRDNTRMYHGDVQYDFSRFIKFANVQLGASYRLFDLQSQGTIFADSAGNDITVTEYGAYVQATKKLLNDKLKLSASLRYDKNENFQAQFNPRASVVISPLENHHFRFSYQTGFRNPTLQGQHVDFNAVSLRLLGGLPQYAQSHNVFQNAFLLSSVQSFSAAVAQSGNPTAPGNPALLDMLTPVSSFDPVKPEEIRSVEAGYRTTIAGNLFLDVVYYYNQYHDFIAQRSVRKASAPIDLDATTFTVANAVAASSLLSPVSTPGNENTFSIYTNVDEVLSAQGVAAGIEYSLPANFKISGNYNWNKLNENPGEGFITEFNTPEHKFNFGVSNTKVTDRIGFSAVCRWQSSYLYESNFAKGKVDDIFVTDLQVSYRLPAAKSVFRIGGSNIFNEYYTPNLGAPSIGGIYYVSVTFDELFR